MTLKRHTGNGSVSAWLAVVTLAGFGIAATWLRLGLPTPGCRLREWTGLPCATCGSTRMLEALLAGDVPGAVAHNPLVFALLVGGLAVSAVALARRVAGSAPLKLVLDPREKRLAGVTAVVLILLDWAWVIWHHA